MVITNALQALDVCVRSLEEILDVPLGTNSGKVAFSENTINDVRTIAEAAIYYRKKKDIGIIGGSVAGITGSVMSIVGAALLPFTFGVSLALVISGGVIGLVAAGAGIGFSIEKVIGDKNRVEEFKPHLEMFVDFNKLFAESTVTIHELLMFIRIKMDPKLFSETLISKQHGRLVNIEKETKNLYRAADAEDDIYEKLKLIDICVKRVHMEIGELVKHMFTLKEMKDFPDTADYREENRRNQHKDQKEVYAFDHLAEAVPLPPIDENETTFRVFVRRYLEVDLPAEKSNHVREVGVTVGKATGKVVVRGTSVGGRAAQRALEASDNLAKVSGAVARIAKGVSAASVVLSAFGIGVDLAFLGHAVYDLVKLNISEDERRSQTRKVSKIESTEFADLLRDLADAMDLINDFCKTSALPKEEAEYRNTEANVTKTSR